MGCIQIRGSEQGDNDPPNSGGGGKGTCAGEGAAVLIQDIHRDRTFAAKSRLRCLVTSAGFFLPSVRRRNETLKVSHLVGNGTSSVAEMQHMWLFSSTDPALYMPSEIFGTMSAQSQILLEFQVQLWQRLHRFGHPCCRFCPCPGIPPSRRVRWPRFVRVTVCYYGAAPENARRVFRCT